MLEPALVAHDESVFSPAEKHSNYSIKQSNQLQKQSTRWLNLAKTLWILISGETSSNSVAESDEGLSSLYDVMEWKMEGKVNDDEFTVLYSEWKKHNSADMNDKVKAPNNYLHGLHMLRRLLLDNNSSERVLTHFIGYILEENNKILVGFPISYQVRDSSLRNISNLELCTDSWLVSCEALFFTLDILGYGILQFDEVLFFCGCLVIGTLAGDVMSNGIQTELDLPELTVMADQFMRDAVNYQSTECHSIFEGQSDVPPPVTLPMFKLYLLSRGIGIRSLRALTQVNIKLYLKRMLDINLVSVQCM